MMFYDFALWNDGCSLNLRTQLSDFTFTFHFHALEEEMATHSSVLAWKIPGTGEPGGLPSMGSHRVGHDWSDLAAAAHTEYQTQLSHWEGSQASSEDRRTHPATSLNKYCWSCEEREKKRDTDSDLGRHSQRRSKRGSHFCSGFSFCGEISPAKAWKINCMLFSGNGTCSLWWELKTTKGQCVCAQLLSHIRLFATPWAVALPGPSNKLLLQISPNAPNPFLLVPGARKAFGQHFKLLRPLRQTFFLLPQ